MDKTPGNLNITPATHQDYPVLAQLHHTCHSLSYRDFAAQEWLESRQLAQYLAHWDELLLAQDQRERSWAARLDNQLVGTVTIKSLRNSSPIFQPLDFQPENLGRSACLRLMYVHPDQQRQGIGRALIETAHQFCLQVGYKTATLITHAAHAAARRFYEAQGWKLDEVFRIQVEEFFREPEEMQLRARYRIQFDRIDPITNG